MIVLDVLGHGAAEVPLPNRNQPVQTFFFDRSHEPVRVGVRIGRTRALDPRVAPRRNVRRHRHDQLTDVDEQTSASAALRVCPLAANQLSVPRQQGVGRRDRRNVPQGCAAETVRSGGERAPIVIRGTKPMATQLMPQQTIAALRGRSRCAAYIYGCTGGMSIESWHIRPRARRRRGEPRGSTREDSRPHRRNLAGTARRSSGNRSKGNLAGMLRLAHPPSRDRCRARFGEVRGRLALPAKTQRAVDVDGL